MKNTLLEQEQKEHKIMYNYSQRLIELQINIDEEETKKILDQLKQACKIMLSINNSQLNKTKNDKIMALITQENNCLDRINRLIEIIINSNNNDLIPEIMKQIEDFKKYSQEIINELAKKEFRQVA